MGNIKSFRMSDRIENMFKSIKKHYLTESNDTKILSTAIERIFGDGALPHNTFYKEKVLKTIEDEKTIELFKKTCELLEVLSFSDGLYLEDEMIYFLTSECADYFYEGYESLGKINYMQYRQLWNNLQLNYGFTEDDLIKLGESLECYYVNEYEASKK